MVDVKIEVVDSAWTNTFQLGEDATVEDLAKAIAEWKAGFAADSLLFELDGAPLENATKIGDVKDKLAAKAIRVTDSGESDVTTVHPVGDANDFGVIVETKTAQKRRKFGVNGETTIAALKGAVASWRGIAAEHQKISFKNEALGDEVKIGDREINDGEVLPLEHVAPTDGKAEAAPEESAADKQAEEERKKKHEEEEAERKKKAEADAAAEKTAADAARKAMQDKERAAAAEKKKQDDAKAAQAKKASSPPAKPLNVMASGQQNKDVDFTDEKLKPAVVALGTPKDNHNWVLFGFQGKSNKLELAGTGEGGLSEFVSTLADDRVMFGIFKVIGADVHQALTSNRDKFIIINWIGKSVGILQKAKVSIQSKCFSSWVSNIAIAGSFDISAKDDLGMEALAKKLLAAGGAHKPTKYVFGPGQEIDIRAWTKA